LIEAFYEVVIFYAALDPQHKTHSYFKLAYYLPRSSLSSSVKLTQIPGKTSLCEWKGKATYWTLKNNVTNEEVKSKVWSYEAPTLPFKDIKGYLSFYASSVPWDCFVDDEKVEPQEGEFVCTLFSTVLTIFKETSMAAGRQATLKDL
jgi:uncharacterized protein (DUF427 family)